MANPQPAWMVDFEAPAAFSDEFDFPDFDSSPIAVSAATRDLDTGALPARGLVLEGLTVTTRASDPIWRTLEPQRATVSLANASGSLTAAFNRDLRGQGLTIRRTDLTDSYLDTRFVGQISQPTLAETITLDATDLKLSVLDDEIPKGTITDALFPGAPDVDAPLIIVNGNGLNIPLFCILDDTDADIFLYLAPRAAGGGALTFNLVKRTGVEGEEFATIHPEEYEILTPAAAAALAGIAEYPAWATILHFPERQFRHGSTELHKLYADISGPEIDRNFSRARRNILSQSWGLSQSVNAASFDAAEAILDGIGDLYADGVIGQDGPVRAGDVLRLLGMAADMWFTFNASGEWVENVDVHTPAVELVLRDGPDEGVRNIVACGPLTPRATDDMVRAIVFKFRPRNGKWTEIRRDLPSPTTWLTTHGKDLPIEHPYVNNATTADKIAYRRMARIRFTDQGVKVTGLQDARGLQYGHVVEITYAPRSLAAAVMEVFGVTDKLTKLDLELHGGSRTLYDAIYAYVSSTLPPGLPVNPIVDFTRTVPDPVTNLAVFGESLRRNLAGDDVVDVTLSFDAPTVNISGIVPLYRVTGTDEWIALGLVPQTGPALLVTIPALVTAEFYDFGIRVWNAPNTLSTDPSTSEDLISGYQVARDTTPPAVPAGFTATVGVGGAFVSLRSTAPTESDYALSYFFRKPASGSAFPTTIAAAIAAGHLLARPGEPIYDDTSVVQGTAYDYAEARADKSGNGSVLCAKQTATPTGAAAGTAPAKPAPVLVFVSATTYQGTDTVSNSTGVTLERVTVRVPVQTLLDPNAAYFQVAAKRRADTQYIPVGRRIAPADLPADVDVPGGLPGEKYDLAYLSAGNLGKVSPLSDALEHVAIGDDDGPALPTSVAIAQQLLSEAMFVWVRPADRDVKGYWVDLRTASGGGGSLVTGFPLFVRAEAFTLLAATSGYGNTRYLRVQSEDHTGNLSGIVNGAGTPTWTTAVPVTFARLDASGTVAPGSVTNPELGSGVVETGNIDDGAVTTPKVASEAVAELTEDTSAPGGTTTVSGTEVVVKTATFSSDGGTMTLLATVQHLTVTSPVLLSLKLRKTNVSGTIVGSISCTCVNGITQATTFFGLDTSPAASQTYVVTAVVTGSDSALIGPTLPVLGVNNKP